MMRLFFLKFTVLALAIFGWINFADAASIFKPVSNLGLVGWWTMDEGSGTIAHDQSGNGKNGTLTNSPTWFNGRRGKALSFDGATNYFRKANFNVGSTQYKTIAFWFKPNSLTGTGTLVSMSADTNDYKWQYIQQANQSISIMFGDNSFYNERANSAISNVFTQVGVWYHVAVTVDMTQSAGNRVFIYVNGVRYTPGFNEDTGNPFYDGSDLNLYIGAWNQGGGMTSYTNGSFDDVRIYNRVLSTSDVLTLYRSGQATRKMVSNNGLVGHWTFNEGTTTKAHDFSGQGNTGTFNGTPLWSNGKKGKSLLFDGGNWIDIGAGSSAIQNLGNTFTIAAWVKTPTPTSRMTVFSTGYSCCAPMFGTSANTPGGLEIYFPGVYVAYTNANLLRADTWHHVAYTKSGTGAGTSRFYIDGVSQAVVGGAESDFSGVSGNLAIAHRSDCCKWNGNIDDVRVYNRTLSASEIAELYGQNEVKVGGSQEKSVSDGLVGYWSFNGKDIDWTANKAWDRSGYDRHGSLVNMSMSSTPVAGKVGQGLNFLAASEYMQVSQPVSSTPFTISMWYYPNAINGNYEILYSGTDNIDLQLFFHAASKELTTSIENSEIPAGLTLTSSTIRKWYNIVWTYDGIRRKVYVNGAITADTADTTALTINDSAVRVGMLLNGGSYTLNGRVDEVRVYNRALSASEAKQLYLLGK